jgi:hypothetical protein
VRVLPSQVVQAIEALIGAKNTDLDERRIEHSLIGKVSAILTLIDRVPDELINLSFNDFVEFVQCREVLSAATRRWVLGDVRAAHQVNGKDPVERIRRLLSQCQDELPPLEPELPFISDVDLREGILAQVATAWNGYQTRDWLSATTFAGASIEAVLLWALKHHRAQSKKPLDDLFLDDMIELADKMQLISKATAAIAHQSKEARNLIHPGKVAREGRACSKATALTAMAGLYRVIEDVKATLP